MLQAEELYRMIHQQKPFVPFRVYLQNGRAVDALHKELVIVGKTYLIIGIPAPGEPEPIYDYTEIVDLVDIARIEPLPASAAPTAS